jgi:light-regulated signal transduction histidine kinase (bacteriophytochrome)
MIDEIAIAPEKYATNENENIRRNGERVWIAWTNKPIVDDSGDVIETLCIGNDVTERRRAEQEIRRLNEDLERRVKERTVQYETTNQELESFSYSVSHDLRAPLRAIDGYTRILLGEHRDTLTPDSLDYLTKVRMNTLAMASLIDALLNFSRTGRQSPVKTLVFPADIVKDALDTLRPDQEGRSIEIRIRDLPSCQADPTMLRQVFQNLLSNALKFTRSRAHTVIEVGAIQSDHRTVYYVRDNGVGFDMAYLNKIFGVFQRLHSREYEGTGVGLAIVQRIVKRHGGSIWAESEVDKGSTFYFALEGESVETKDNRKTD